VVGDDSSAIATNGLAEPADVRPRLAKAAAASLDDLQAALLDAALGATREHWITMTCPDCGRKQRVEVKIPDVRSRVAAIELLLREGLGRPREAAEAPAAILPQDPLAVERLSWLQLRVLAEIHDRDLVRSEIASLSTEQRDVLREALAATG
jgi:hypothetical protein